MKFRKLISVFAIISMLMLSLGATVMMVGAQEPEETPTEEAGQEAPPEPTVYVVQEGDSYDSIAEAFGVTVEALQEANGLDGSEELVAGQELVIPEPVVEEEPPAEPTEEATEEPPAEPTEEATEEPPAEPTEEATEEPPAEPTEEATEEPPAEPTEEATEEPPAEPTEEAIEEPTEEAPPSERVGEPENLAGAEGEIGSAAIPGTWTTQIIRIQNLGASPANAQLDLFQGDPIPVDTIAKDDIPVNGSKTIVPSEFSDGRYAGIMSADEPVAVGVLTVNSSGTVGDAYLGFDTLTDRQTLPAVFRNHSQWKSKFHIQNASATQQTVTVYAYPRTGGGAWSDDPTYDIPGNSSITVDFMSSDFDNFGSGQGAYGHVVVEGTADLVAVSEAVKDNVKDGELERVQAYYEGLRDDQAGRTLIAPTWFNGHSFWDTGVSVINLENVTTTLTYSYTENPDFYSGAQHTRTEELGPFARSTFYGPLVSPALPRPSFGSLTIHSSDSDIVATVNSVKYVGGSVGYTGQAFNPDLATTKIAAPLAFNQGLNTGWVTGISVYSVGSAGTISTKWVRADQDPTNPVNYFDYSQPGVSNGQISFYAPLIPGMLSNFGGVVYISSPTPIMAIVNSTNYATGMAVQIPGYNYE